MNWPQEELPDMTPEVASRIFERPWEENERGSTGLEKAKCCPGFPQKGKKMELTNQKPVRLTQIPEDILEDIIKEMIR